MFQQGWLFVSAELFAVAIGVFFIINGVLLTYYPEPKDIGPVSGFSIPELRNEFGIMNIAIGAFLVSYPLALDYRKSASHVRITNI